MSTAPANISGPKKGEGWDDFVSDEADDSVWLEAFETVEQDGEEVVDIDAYDEFANIPELVNFVAGTGTYRDRNSFEPGEADLTEQKRELHQMAGPQCPECVERINEFLEEGAMKSEVDIDPYVEVNYWVEEEDAEYHDDFDLRKTAHAVAYCPEDGHSDDVFFHYESSWFD